MKTTSFIKTAMIAALLTQVTHAATVFLLISKTQNSIIDVVLSYVFAISLELSIYIFTLSKKKKPATIFAVISIAINVLYYWNFNVFDFSFYASLIISITIPATIWSYSELLHEDNVKRKKADTVKEPGKRKRKKKVIQTDLFKPEQIAEAV